MPGKLTNFLSELAVSPEKLAKYQQNPDAAMTEAGLDADECAALRSGDPAKVYASLSGQSASGGQGPILWSPQANCIWGAQPQANCIWSAQPQSHCIWAPQPQVGPNCIWAPQPQANCIWSAQPQSHCIWAPQPQVGPNCIWAAQPQANCIWSAQPPTVWSAQPYSIVVVVHHFIHAAQPQPNISTPAPAEPNQPSSQPSK